MGRLIKQINFKELRETDVLASKGAYLYLIEKDNHKFKIRLFSNGCKL